MPCLVALGIWLLITVPDAVRPTLAQQIPAPPLYVLLPERYPYPIARVCSTQWGICALPTTVVPGTPCYCRAANGAWLPGVCTH